MAHYEFIETSAFSSYLPDYLSDEDYTVLQEHLCETPEAGDLVRGSGGVRICYYARTRRGQILMLVIYEKSTRDSLSGHVLKALCEELENGID